MFRIRQKKLKQITRWAGRNPKTALAIVILFQTIFLLWGIFIGLTFYAHDYTFPTWLPYLIIGITGGAMFVFNESELTYLKKRLLWLFYSYATFFAAVCFGNYSLRTDYQTTVDLVEEVLILEHTYNNPYIASIEYGSPPIEKIKKKKWKKNKYENKAIKKRYWKKRIKNLTDTAGKKVWLLVFSILFFVLATVCVVLICVALCASNTLMVALLLIGVAIFIISAIALLISYKKKVGEEKAVQTSEEQEKHKNIDKVYDK